MHKTIFTAALAAASLLALSACNQQPAAGNNATGTTAASADAINGTWKADIASVKFDQKPDEYLLKDGQYSCKSCVPSYTVAADGAFHAVSLPYADSIAVKVVDDHTIQRMSKKGDRQIGESKVTVSADPTLADTAGQTPATAALRTLMREAITGVVNLLRGGGGGHIMEEE